MVDVLWPSNAVSIQTFFLSLFGVIMRSDELKPAKLKRRQIETMTYEELKVEFNFSSIVADFEK